MRHSRLDAGTPLFRAHNHAGRSSPLAIDDDDRGWPKDQRHHLVHAAKELGHIETQLRLRNALVHWMSSHDADTVFIGNGGSLIAMGDGRTWGAHSPEELIAKLDADGITRSQLVLIMADDLCCPDHALSSHDEAAFVELLGNDIPR